MFLNYQTLPLGVKWFCGVEVIMSALHPGTCNFERHCLTRQDGRMSRTYVSNFGRMENPNIVCSNSGRVKSMTLKLILVAA